MTGLRAAAAGGITIVLGSIVAPATSSERTVMVLGLLIGLAVWLTDAWLERLGARRSARNGRG